MYPKPVTGEDEALMVGLVTITSITHDMYGFIYSPCPMAHDMVCLVEEKQLK